MQKNVVCLSPFHHTWVDVVSTLNEQFGWRPILWIGTRTELLSEVKNRFKDLRFYDHSDAKRAIPPKELPALSLAAVDAELLERLSEYESVIYEMISRVILGKDCFTYDERRHLYYNLLRIWVAILRELRVDIVISGNVPHRIYDYVIYLVCQEMGVTYLMIEQANLPHLSYGVSSITDRSRAIREEYNKIHTDITLEPRTEEYLSEIKGSYEDAMPSYYREKVVKSQHKSLVRRVYNSLSYDVQTAVLIAKNALQGRLFEETDIMYFKRSTRCISDTPDYANRLKIALLQRRVNIDVSNAKRWYQENAVKPDLSRPYIYFAPSYQPERSTCPDAGIYYDLHLVVDVLSKSIPDGWYIYYKEHPTTFRFPLRIDNARDTRFYERIRKIPNCIFIDYESNSFKLIDNSIATVVSGSGTSVWEAVLRGVPAIEFGDYWYSCCPGIFKVNTLKECRDAIAKIQSGYRPDQREIRRYLAAADAISEDLQFRRPKDASFKDIEENEPLEYKRRIQLLAKVLADEYFRIRPDSKLVGSSAT